MVRKKKEKGPEEIIEGVRRSKGRADTRNMFFGLIVGTLLGLLGNMFINSLFDFANYFGGVPLSGKLILMCLSLGVFILLLWIIYDEFLR